MSTKITPLLCTIALFILIAAGAVHGQQDDPRFHAEVFVAGIFDSGSNVETYGVRGGARLSPRWTLEGALSRVDDAYENVYLFDASARLSLRPTRRVDIFFIGGPGWFWTSDFDGSLMFSAGFGSQIPLGKRFYLRPELRARWVEQSDVVGTDLSFGFGARF